METKKGGKRRLETKGRGMEMRGKRGGISMGKVKEKKGEDMRGGVGGIKGR